MGSLSGKRAWVTGASSGIGAATARLLAEHGAQVVLSARREDRLRALARELGSAVVQPVDVADRRAMERLGEELDAMGGVDILVANAGLMPLSPMIEGRVDEWEQMIDVNLKGLLYSSSAPSTRGWRGGRRDTSSTSARSPAGWRTRMARSTAGPSSRCARSPTRSARKRWSTACASPTWSRAPSPPSCRSRSAPSPRARR